jgi:(1->4)-alpha-D-glucan 1-alpha-D-glucosylmutase
MLWSYLVRPAYLPTSTYRLQLHAGFTFVDAAAITDYLDALGISHVYSSSYLKAVPGSGHGYDVTDPTCLNPEVGDGQTFAAWINGLRARNMGHILDVVPNHMGIARSANPWWQDVLENGPSSRFAEVFDIDWHPLKPELEGKVLLPVLGDIYGAVLERQEIQLEYHHGAFTARYHDHLFPIAPRTYEAILTVDLNALLEDMGEQSEDGVELLSILTALRHLPGLNVQDPELRVERDREKEVIKRRLASLTARAPRVLAHVMRAVTTMNGRRGEPATFDALDALLSQQPYRLSYWRVAAEEINYRRFFDINELAAVRTEDPAVFDRVHAFVLDLLARGLVDGLRIDHVDGLHDPGGYLERVQARAIELAPDRFSTDHPLFVVVEKILGYDESLPAWPVAGTTGYDFAATVGGLFVDPANERAVNDTYERFTRLRVPFREICYRGKQLVLRVSMPSELNVLAHRLNRFSERSRHYRDFTLNSLNQAMREIVACFPVYRTYVNEREVLSERDRFYIEAATREARRRNPNRPAAVYDFVRDLLLRKVDYLPARERDAHLRFVGTFQQVTSPVTAKGVEDTALYIYNRLVSLNDVGTEPDRFGTAPERLHQWMAERPRHGLSATSTHDTKRSEDVRARISVLSELTDDWRAAVSRWARLNRRGRSTIDGQSFPSRNDEFLLYQTLLGTWPTQPTTAEDDAVYLARIVAYMHKAMRESKIHTSWLNPSEAHERAMTRFVEFVLARDHAAFRSDFHALAQRIARHGIYNSLAQVAIKIAAPGVPDFYQGTELLDFSLVDPDNRRPVDYARRRAMLRELDAAEAREGRTALARRLAADADDGLKLYATTMMLRFRRNERAIFDEGTYAPLTAGGQRARHVFAFARTHGTRAAVVAVPRLTVAISGSDQARPNRLEFHDTVIPAPAGFSTFHHVLTGRCVPVSSDPASRRLALRAADVFEDFPIALLDCR